MDGSRGNLRSTVEVTILDISAGGLQLELSASLRPGAVYDLKADVGGHPLSMQIRITRCTAGGYRDDRVGGRCLLYRAGAEFLWTEAEPKKALEQHLDRAREQRPGSPSALGILRLRK